MARWYSGERRGLAILRGLEDMNDIWLLGHAKSILEGNYADPLESLLEPDYWNWPGLEYQAEAACIAQQLEAARRGLTKAWGGPFRRNDEDESPGEQEIEKERDTPPNVGASIPPEP